MASKQVKATKQLQTAEELGRKAFNKTIMCVPAKDKDLLDMLVGRKIGETPEGEASTVNIMKAWMKGWYAERDISLQKIK